MQIRPTLCILAFVSVSLFAMTAIDRLALADEKPAKKLDAEFDGKVVTIYFADPERGRGQILMDVALTEIGGRMMLVGTGADTGDDDDWTAGVRIGVAWDSVATYYAMTQKQYDEKLKKHAK